ncbi:hypothetical protein [Arthrobacter sp. B1I2]|uniref:hypothetical protein n=1 Tax=Arthrobacter sp. B1I2 TaxID=3042263 RepID=UPI00278AE3A4|nr:hypothetical protein [Arthrobacter sp. B1I2]MDQ0733470.1 hypothetical protein [Arthrobacter sp. B1I2]
MKILVACEYSGRVRDAFIALGHDAISCDLLPTDSPGPHYQGDVRDLLYTPGWDLMVAHPPCTDLATSGNAHMKKKIADGRVDASLAFVRLLLNAPIPRIAVENPRSIISSRIRPADQLIHPWQFGHGEQKATCLWLKNLPQLVPTDVVEGREQRLYNLSPSETRWKERSETFPGIAAAMAAQWSRPGAVQTDIFDVLGVA